VANGSVANGSVARSLNVIARRAGVAKGSLFQYFADKRDLYAFIADVASQCVHCYMEDRIRELDARRPFTVC
jgi:AcrR family transcriptional regulator